MRKLLFISLFQTLENAPGSMLVTVISFGLVLCDLPGIVYCVQAVENINVLVLVLLMLHHTDVCLKIYR